MAARLDLTIEKEATFKKTFRWKQSDGTAYDLTDFTALLHIRLTADSETPEFTLSDGSGITITAVEGKIEIELTDVQTAAITWETAVYDLLLTNTVSGDKTRLIEGTITTSDAVTRS
jgi:hypothetical protein